MGESGQHRAHGSRLKASHPNGFAHGYPGKLYTRGEAESAIADATIVIDLLAVLSPLPCPMDLFVLTRDELERARQEGAPLVREALSHGIDLL